MKKSINNEAINIQRRFFMAIEILISSGELSGGLMGFCTNHHLNRTKYSKIKNSLDKSIDEMTYKMIDLDALSGLCRDYGVRPNWLLLGRGKMFVKGGRK